MSGGDYIAIIFLMAIGSMFLAAILYWVGASLIDKWRQR